MASDKEKEVEVKFRVAEVRRLAPKLREAGFQIETARTHERNTLYDLSGGVLQARK